MNSTTAAKTHFNNNNALETGIENTKRVIEKLFIFFFSFSDDKMKIVYVYYV